VARCNYATEADAPLSVSTRRQYRGKASEQSVSAWFGSPVLIDRIDESVERGIPLDLAIRECTNGRSCAVK